MNPPAWAAIAFLATCALSPVVLSALARLGMNDQPNVRSSHTRPTVRGGGLACMGGITAGAIAGTGTHSSGTWVSIAICVTMGLVGLLDDRFDLHPAPRLAAQVALGAVLGSALDGPLWPAIGAIAMPVIVNTVNFMDGINGITAVTLAIWGVTTALFAARAGLPGVTAIGALTAGAAIGFLPWNAPRAKMFLGDVGSYLFGALATAGALTTVAERPNFTVLVLAPLAPYFVDVSVTLVRRLSRGESPLKAHREHTYQKIQQLTNSHMAATALVACTSVLTTVAWASTPAPAAAALTSLLSVVYLAMPSILGKSRDGRRQVDGGVLSK